MSLYKELIKALEFCDKQDDEEIRHIDADDILKQVAINASKGLLNEIEVVSLIKVYDDIIKYYS